MKGLLKLVLFGSLSLTSMVASAADWQKILTCDQGRVWVDVDVNDRQNVQLVIRNQAANQYLTELGVQTNGADGMDYEKRMLLKQENGIFSPSGFTSATKNSSFQSMYNTVRSLGSKFVTSYDEAAYLYRDGNGVKLEIIRRNLNYCDNYYARFSTCDHPTRYVAEENVGNWYFADCQ